MLRASLKGMLSRKLRLLLSTLAVVLGVMFVSGALVLTGVESLATDEGKLVRFAPGDQLVLNGEAFSVESPAPVKYAAPENVTR